MMRYFLLGLLLVLPAAAAAPLTVTLTDDTCAVWSVTRTGPVIACTQKIPTTPTNPGSVVCPGYEGRTKNLLVTIPASSFTKYAVTEFRQDAVLVVRFKAPPADPSFQVNWVQLGGQTGPTATRRTTLSRRACDFSEIKGGDTLYTDEAPGFSMVLATMQSSYSRYILTPGEWYYVNIRNRAPDGVGCGATYCDISFATANNRP